MCVSEHGFVLCVGPAGWLCVSVIMSACSKCVGTCAYQRQCVYERQIAVCERWKKKISKKQLWRGWNKRMKPLVILKTLREEEGEEGEKEKSKECVYSLRS